MTTEDSAVWDFMFHRNLSEDSHGDDHGGDDGDHGSFGVHIDYNILYSAVVFLFAIYVGGKIASKICKMPDLVGEIFVGILLGPELANYAPNPKAWVLLGELGLILLVIEAGIDIDVATLKIIGARGMLIAIAGSVLPILFAIVIAKIIGPDDWKATLAAGATFGPTSLGIALNILRGGGVLNTPVGQLIISAAVIDDMIALVILSQLESLTGPPGSIDVVTLLIPVISAVLFLVLGGYIAIWVLPPFLEKYVLAKLDHKYHDKVELSLMILILLGMMPATKYGKASYLMGAFVAGLSFCTSHGLHALFVRQFKRLLQWLMRIFFAASIGFQVPITSFGDAKVIWQGAVYSLALIGKLAVGFMVPNFTQSRSFTKFHLRDCLITGFSMAAEGEFAFVIAVFSVDAGLIDTQTYASVVLAVLMSTIVPPFLLRFTISYYEKKTAEEIEQAAKDEMDRKHDLESTPDDLLKSVLNRTAVFMCIQTQSDSQWGLMFSLMSTMAKLKLEVIDHRSWHPRGVSSTSINEIYIRDTIEFEKDGSKEALEQRMNEIKAKMEQAINQKDEAKVKVQRWYPGVVEEITENNNGKEDSKHFLKTHLGDKILMEAESKLSRKSILMDHATKGKSVAEIFQEIEGERGNNGKGSTMAVPEEAAATAGDLENGGGGVAIRLNADTLVPIAENKASTVRRRAPRTRRQKTRSTPVVGGGLFGETGDNGYSKVSGNDNDSNNNKLPTHEERVKQAKDMFQLKSPGFSAEIIIRGESYKIRVSDATYKGLQTGYSGAMLDSRGISVNAGLSIQQDDTSIVNKLQGYVRSADTLGTISETIVEGDDESERSSLTGKA